MKKSKINYAGMFTLRSDGRYQASWSDETGRHFLYDRDPERLFHRLNDPKQETTFAQIAEAWAEKHRERVGFKTFGAYKPCVDRLIGQFGADKAEDVSPQEISAYLVELGNQGYAKRTVQMHRDILNMIFNEAILAGASKTNPCAAVSLPRNLPAVKRELPTDAALQAVKDGCDHPLSLFAQICLYSGLRRGEVLALRYEDIDRNQKVIHVTKAVEFIDNNPQIKPPKTKAGARDVVLLDILAEKIPSGRGLIFQQDGKPLTATMFRKRWLAYCQQIGHEITPHQLRHGFATILYEAGIPDKDAQELLGHASITTTRDIYTHIRQSRKDETKARLNAFLSH